MSIELTLLISVIALAASIYFGLAGLRRTRRLDIQTEAGQLAAVIAKLESISVVMAEIKVELTNVKNDLKELRERLVVAEGSTIRAHQRLDEYINMTKNER